MEVFFLLYLYCKQQLDHYSETLALDEALTFTRGPRWSVLQLMSAVCPLCPHIILLCFIFRPTVVTHEEILFL